MSIDTTFLRRCLATLERAIAELEQTSPDSVAYDIYRAACVKEFELILEQSGKLLRKKLALWFASNRQADRLAFKDLFRHAAKHGLIGSDEAERW
ncbi:MAG: nucleotidyltransferase substrate binding protein, partial [Gammaproteobacteria bacterium]|nr:nucleotidyltransferase substrate binding protein [Gammaproteobacteria bacterium]